MKIIQMTLAFLLLTIAHDIWPADVPESTNSHYYAPGEFKKLSPARQTLVIEELTDEYKLKYPLHTSRIVEKTTERGKTSYVRENPSLEEFLRSHGIELGE